MFAVKLPSVMATKPAYRRTQHPPAPSHLFTGREDLLAQMKKCFSREDSSAESSGQLVFVLHGLGGAGKTQTVLKLLELETENVTCMLI